MSTFSIIPHDEEQRSCVQCSEYETRVEELETQNEELRIALQEANDKILSLNQQIEDAQSSAGGTYGEMRDSLETLETEDEVYEP